MVISSGVSSVRVVYKCATPWQEADRPSNYAFAPQKSFSASAGAVARGGGRGAGRVEGAARRPVFGIVDILSRCGSCGPCARPVELFC